MKTATFSKSFSYFLCVLWLVLSGTTLPSLADVFNLGTISGAQTKNGTLTASDYYSELGMWRYRDSYIFSVSQSGTLQITSCSSTVMLTVASTDEKFTTNYNVATRRGPVRPGYSYTIEVYEYQVPRSYTLKFTVPGSIPTPTYYTVTTGVENGGGSVTGGGQFQSGAQCTLRAIPNSGYRFVSWTIDPSVSALPGGNANPYTFTVDHNITLMATFSRGLALKGIQISGETSTIEEGGKATYSCKATWTNNYDSETTTTVTPTWSFSDADMNYASVSSSGRDSRRISAGDGTESNTMRFEPLQMTPQRDNVSRSCSRWASA